LSRLALRQFHLVRENRLFGAYWAGNLVSQLGTWTQVTATSWIVLRLTGNPTSLGYVSMAVNGPSLAITLFGGAAADRYDRRRIQLVTQSGLFAASFAIAWLAATGRLEFWAIIALSLVTGVAVSYDGPAQMATTMSLVAPSEIQAAMSLNGFARNSSRFVGPALAGVLLTRYGDAAPFFLNAASFLVMLAVVFWMPALPGSAKPGSNVAQQIRDGLAYVRGSRTIRALLGVLSLAAIIGLPLLAVLAPHYAKSAMHGDAGLVAIFMATSGVASIVGALAIAWVPMQRAVLVQAVSVVVCAAGLVGLGFVHGTALGLAVYALATFALSLIIGLNDTSMQSILEPSYRGRVFSVTSLIMRGGIPLAAIGFGAISKASDIRPVYIAGGALFAMMGLVAVWRAGRAAISSPPPPASPA
jgi:predicted MFS family arabinose efflux permease